MRIVLCLGTGGVGKTSVSAAIALAHARQGRRTLVITTDPSHRLKTVLGLSEGLPEQRVPIDGRGELWAALLDTHATLDEAVRRRTKPQVAEKIFANGIYRSLTSSLPGMAELMAAERIHQLVERGFDDLVVDTAPSRHALEVLDRPVMAANLTGAGRVKIVGRTYKFFDAIGLTAIGKSALDIYKRIESVLGANLVEQILDFYSMFYPIAEGYGKDAQETVEWLRDPSITTFRVVSTPLKAVRDASFFLKELSDRNFRMTEMYINRAWIDPPPASRPDGLAGQLLDWYASVGESHRAAIESLHKTYDGQIGNIRVIPELERDVDGMDALNHIAATFENP